MNKWTIIVIVVAVVIAGFVYFIQRGGLNRDVETGWETSEDNPFLKMIGEYRTSIANYYCNLLEFWCGTGEFGHQVCGFNENLITYLKENLEVNAHFKWEEEVVEINTKVYSEIDGYVEKSRKFKFKNKTLPTKKIYKFIISASNLHEELNKTTSEDLFAIVAQLKGMPAINATEAEKLLFDYTIETLSVMRSKKFRRNKKLLTLFIRLMNLVVRGHKDNFIKYISNEKNRGEE